MTQLLKSHRATGYEVARAIANDGTELVILQTAPHSQTVAPARTLMEVQPHEMAFEIKVALIETLEKARFLGLDSVTLQGIFQEALEKSEG